MVNGKLSDCKFLGLFQGIQFADIEDIEVVLHQTDDVAAVTDGEVEVDDAETVGETVHQREQSRRERVDAREREGVE